MAYAIHKTASSGETLQTVATTYYDLLKPSDEVDRVRQRIVIQAIRSATPVAVTDLSTFEDDDTLNTKTLFIPTLRQLNRALLLGSSPPSGMADAFRDKGIVHARKLLRRRVEDVVLLLTPTYSESDIRKAYVLTQFFNLDGMDRYTALHLYETQNIDTLTELAAQAPATLLGILEGLLEAPHNRPAQLTTQRHDERWPREAKLYGRSRISEANRAHWTRPFAVVLPPNYTRSLAEHYERLRRKTDLEPKQRQSARAMEVLLRFQERVLRGHRALLAGKNREAVGHYEATKQLWHRWLHRSGAVATPVDDKLGVSLNTTLTGVQKLLGALSNDDEEREDGSDAPALPGGSSVSKRGLGVRGFSFEELTSSARTALRTEIDVNKLRRFPLAFRRAVHRQILEKTRSELSSADTNLTQGLSSATGDAQVRDFDPEDQQRVLRNLGASNFSVLATLGLLDVAAVRDALHLEGIAADVSGTFWETTGADEVLETAAMDSYPSWMENQSPFLRFVVLPALEGQSLPQVLRIRSAAGDFQTDWVEQFYKERAKSGKAADLVPSRAAWEVPAIFALWIPVLYGKILPQGLAMAHARIGLSHIPDKRPPNQTRQLNVYNSSGTLVGGDRHDLLPADLKADTDLLLSSSASSLPAGVDTYWDLMLCTYVQTKEADRLYAIGELPAARSLYQDIVHYVEIFEPTVAEEADAAMVGAASYGDDTPDLSPPTLTGFEDPGGQILGGLYHETRGTLGTSTPGTEALAVAQTQFLFDTPPNPEEITLSTRPTVDYDALLENNLSSRYSASTIVGQALDPEANYKAAIWSDYLHALAMIGQIDLGLNILGYRTDYIPPWSAEHLYGAARDLCNRALDAESRVQSLIALQESATAEELVAGNNVTNSSAQVTVAQARLTEQVAQNQIAREQAKLSALQTEIAERQNEAQRKSEFGQIVNAGKTGAEQGAAIGTAIFPVVGTIIGGIVGGAAAAVPGLIDWAKGAKTQDLYENATTAANTIVEQTQTLAQASRALAITELDAATLRLEGDLQYARFLTEERLLNADAYAQLVSIAQQVAEAYLSESIRLSWLAQRALAHETRRNLRFIKTSYTEEDAVTDLTRAQKLTADLELMQASYVAGETVRRQEIKFTLSLRDMQPGALGELRESGECVFVLEQEVVDRAFPGLYLHALKEMKLAFVGTLPPEGPRGTLITLGKGLVRVPNDVSYFDGSPLQTDWAAARLAGETGAYANWARYIMKQVNTQGTVLTLSEFDVTEDRAVLRVPQGMLGAVELLGLDNAWMLRLHPQSNRFPWKAIFDVELTCWFLACYDADIEGAQHRALRLQAEEDESLQGTMVASAAQGAGPMWSAFVRDATSEESADVRYLSFDRGEYAPSEASFTTKRLTNFYLGTPQDQEIVLRVLCTDDPVGTLVTSKLGCAFTYLLPPWNAPHNPQPPWPSGERQPDGDDNPPTGLTKWVRDTFYSSAAEPGKVPSKAPSERFVIKLLPDKANPAGSSGEWRALDADGDLVRTTYGSLSAGAGALATWEGNTALTHVRFMAKLKTRGGRLRMVARQVDANNGYRFVIDDNSAKVSKVNAGSSSDLQSKTLSYPTDEWLFVVFDVYGDSSATKLRVEIDGIEILKVTDSSSPHTSGRIGFDVNSTPSAPFEIDDVEVVRLSKLGLAQEVLLQEPFSSTTLPSDWSFTGGSPAWAVSTTGHTFAALSALADVVLRIDYGFKP